MMKVAVTGATGFVGNFVAAFLESNGYEVVRFGRKEKEGIVRWDISKGPYVPKTAVDVVVHCAAHVSDWSSYKGAFTTNVTGTQNVIASFPTATTFIYISSASVYSPDCTDIVITETSCVGGTSLNNYGKTKLLGEEVVASATIKSRIILRPHIIYGPGDTTIGPRIRGGIRNNKLIIPGNGKNHISFTHVENLANAILKAIQCKKEGISIYNITDGTAPQFVEALAAFKKLNNLDFKTIYIPRWVALVIGTILSGIFRLFHSKHAPILTPYIVYQMTNDHILDISKAARELHYVPTRQYDTDFYV